MSAANELPAKLRPLVKQAGLTMLALDQRGSLRTIIANGRPESTVADERLAAFKAAAAEILSPLASAVLLDSQFGRRAMRLVAPGVPLILSADTFDQKPGGPVERSMLDDGVTPALIEECGAVAIKLLLIWTPGSGMDFRRDQVGRFVDLAKRTGRIALVEGIARDERGERFTSARDQGAAVIEAAKELVAEGPDIYKAEVPGYLPGDLGEVASYSRLLTGAIAQPWVVLSNGVAAEDFPAAVRSACGAGASGFLAGRAIWSHAAAQTDPRPELASRSAARLRELVDIVAASQAAATG